MKNLLYIATVTLACLILAAPSYAHGTIAPNVPYHHNWIRVARCESGLRWWLNGTYDGGLQFLPSTWTARGTRWRYAYQAPAWAQIAAANQLRSQRASQWPRCSRYW